MLLYPLQTLRTAAPFAPPALPCPLPALLCSLSRCFLVRRCRRFLPAAGASLPAAGASSRRRRFFARCRRFLALLPALLCSLPVLPCPLLALSLPAAGASCPLPWCFLIGRRRFLLVAGAPNGGASCSPPALPCPLPALLARCRRFLARCRRFLARRRCFLPACRCSNGGASCPLQARRAAMLLYPLQTLRTAALPCPLPTLRRRPAPWRRISQAAARWRCSVWRLIDVAYLVRLDGRRPLDGCSSCAIRSASSAACWRGFATGALDERRFPDRTRSTPSKSFPGAPRRWARARSWGLAPGHARRRQRQRA